MFHIEMGVFSTHSPNESWSCARIRYPPALTTSGGADAEATSSTFPLELMSEYHCRKNNIFRLSLQYSIASEWDWCCS